jgi:hypothetical protein
MSHSQHLLHLGSNNYILFYSNMLTKAIVFDIHCLKKVSYFPVPSWDVTYQTLSGVEYFNYFRLGRVWLVTSTGKSLTFLQCILTRNQAVSRGSISVLRGVTRGGRGISCSVSPSSRNHVVLHKNTRYLGVLYCAYYNPYIHQIMTYQILH